MTAPYGYRPFDLPPAGHPGLTGTTGLAVQVWADPEVRPHRPGAVTAAVAVQLTVAALFAALGALLYLVGAPQALTTVVLTTGAVPLAAGAHLALRPGRSSQTSATVTAVLASLAVLPLPLTLPVVLALWAPRSSRDYFTACDLRREAGWGR